MRNVTRGGRLLGAFATGILLVTACSSGSSTSPTSATTAPSAVTSQTSTSAAPTTEPATTAPATTAHPTTEPATTEPVSTEPVSTEAETTITTAATTPIPPYTSAIYNDPAHWICRGDTADICDQSYPLSKLDADATVTPVPFTVAQDPPIDCFYVYPTSSADLTYNSDLTPDSEIGVTQYQVARFDQVCKMYVPVYRSVTLAGLFGQADGNIADGFATAYADVLDAWRSYLSNDNHGRAVVIISHSQGSFHVQRLLREEIDPNPAERKLVVSAILPGTSFQVAKGSDIGGDTQNMPLCRHNDQFGCIITFQSYRAGAPPAPGAPFGKPGETTDSACTNPAALAGGAGLLDNSFAAGDWIDSDPAVRAKVTTNLVDLPELVTAECEVTPDGYSYLAITVNADPADARADDIPGDGTPNWGLHTIDLNVTQETLIQLVREQSAAYLAASPS